LPTYSNKGDLLLVGGGFVPEISAGPEFGAPEGISDKN
jgi:hypothetical protein